MKAKFSWLTRRMLDRKHECDSRDSAREKTSGQVRFIQRVEVLFPAAVFLGWSLLLIPFSSQARGPASSPPPADAPRITQSPASETVLENRSVDLKVIATGSDLYFQWFHDDRLIPGATNSAWSLSTVRPHKEGQYSVRVYNRWGEADSDSAQVNVLRSPSIRQQPVSQIITQGVTIAFGVLAEGTPPLEYQWTWNGVALPGETTAKLERGNVQPSQSGCYAVKIRSQAGTIISSNALLSVLVPPSFRRLPRTSVAMLGARFSFVAQAEGTEPLRYQWHRNGQKILNATSETLVIDSARVEDSGNYSVSVQNPAGFELSPAANLLVMVAPKILIHPVDVVVAVSNSVELSVAASGTGPLTYIWRQDGLEVFGDPTVSGASSPVLQIPQIRPDQAGNYEVVVCNYAGAVTSRVATVQVKVPPFIITPPQGQTVSMFDDLVLSVKAGGSPDLKYQWRHNGANIPEATNSVLGPLFVQQDAGGTYSVVVENSVHTVASDPAFVLIDNPVLMPSDSFQGAPAINWQIGCTFLQGSNRGFSKESGEPAHAGRLGGTSGWYRWKAPTTSLVTLETTGSTFDTLLAVYAGNDLTHLLGVASSEDSGGLLTSRLTFIAKEGEEYSIAVDGFDGEAGDFLLTAVVQPTTASQMPIVVVPPLSGSGPRGRSTNLFVVAQGNNLSYQWHFLTKPLLHETNDLLILPNIQPVDVGTYFVRVRDSETGLFVDSESAVVEIGPVIDVVSQDKRYFGAEGSPIGALPPTPAAKPELADFSTSAGTIVVRPGVQTDQIINNFVSTLSRSDPKNCNWVGGATRWITNIVVEKKGVLVIDTRESSVPTLTGLFTYVSARAHLVSCSSEGVILYTNEVDGGVYDLMADSVQGQGGIISLKMSLIQLPKLNSTGAQEESLYADQAVTLDAGVVNDPVPPPTYQWFLNQTNLIANATGRTLSLERFQASDAGLYTVRVRTVIGDLTHRVASLSLKFPATWSLQPTFPTAFGSRRDAVWARNSSEAYLLENAVHPGDPSLVEAGIYRSSGQDWELMSKIPAYQGKIIHGSGTSDLVVLLNRAEGAVPASVLLESSDRGSTWTTHAIPSFSPERSAQTVSGITTRLQVLLEDGTILLRKDGNWSTLLSGGAPPLTDLILVDDQHGFAVSRQALWKWDGLRWREATAAPVGFLCEKLLAFAEGDQFNALVLGRDSANGKTRIWQAVSPTLAPAATTPNPIESTLPSEEITESVGLCGTTQSDLYLLARQAGEAGQKATSKIYHFDGRTWTRVSELGSLPTASAIGGSGRDDVWIPLVDGRLARRQNLFPSSGPRVTIKLIESPIVLGATATFSSEVTGTGPFSYQWRQGASDLVGATHSELLIYPVSQNSIGTYRVKVTSASGTADAQADLTQVKSPPLLLHQPQALSAYAGSAAEFVIEVMGEGPLMYQWFSSTGPVKAENKPVLSLEGLRIEDSGPYWAEVSNLYGKVASDRALLSVLPGLHLSATSILTPHQFTGAADRPFVIEKSSDLLDWTPWFTNQVLRFAAPFEVLDADAVRSPYLFYRVREW